MISNVRDMFEEMLGSITDQDDYYPFFLRAGCVKMAAPRHSRFEWILEIGRPSIDKIFSGDVFDSDVITLVFPERFLSVHEQQNLLNRIKLHSDVDTVKRVDLITSSPLIVGNCGAGSLRVLTWEDDDKHNGELQ